MKKLSAAVFLVAVLLGYWYWKDSRSQVVLLPGGKAAFFRGGVFHRDKFDLERTRKGAWHFSRGEPFEIGELILPFECRYNDVRTLLLDEFGRVYLLDRKSMTREELRVVDGEWSYDATDHWVSIFDLVVLDHD